MGTGYTQGSVEAKSGVNIANEFLGFFKNFVDVFNLQGEKVYIAGESCASSRMFVPYISSAMPDASDTTYYNLNGVLIYDPSINYDEVLEDMQAVPFASYWDELFTLNHTYMKNLNARDESCGCKAFREANFDFPPTGILPSLPSIRSQHVHYYEMCWTSQIPSRTLQQTQLSSSTVQKSRPPSMHPSNTLRQNVPTTPFTQPPTATPTKQTIVIGPV